MAGLFISILFLVLPLSSLQAQEQAEKDPYDHRMLGDRALSRGKMKEACDLYVNALAHRPGDLEILEKLLEASRDDADAKALWSMAWYIAAADAQGRAKPDVGIKKLLSPMDPYLAKITRLRVQAKDELVAFSESREKQGASAPDEYLAAQWARRLALELSEDESLDPLLTLPDNFHLPVIRALEGVMNSALMNKRTGTAMRAARCLRGLGAQAQFKDLKGKRPRGMDKVLQKALKGLARAREQLLDRVGEPWTVEELEWLTREEGETFTREHSSFANPGVALSPNGLYRIETDCGYETLLGAARTVELHHRRLANWFGQDPFAKKQGVIRIVPESHGLESEGAGFWWAGGFQSGDVTVVKFSCGTIEGLGHGITHELTHRFDGALFPGTPAWLLEGRAVWTGGAYGFAEDERFTENHARFGTVQHAYRKGFGGMRRLTELIEGETGEYRDNYFAGYALYLFLKTWEQDGIKPFAGRLEAYMKGASSHRKKRKAWFVKNFADGKEGMPEGMEAFALEFHTFLKGFYWKTRQPWTDRYVKAIPGPENAPIVYDEPTWVWSRSRAEPFFGQDQARETGLLLLEEGRRKEGIRSLIWALSVDGRSPGMEGVLRDALKKDRQKESAWVLDLFRAFPLGIPAGPAPFRHSLRFTKQLLAALEEAAADYRERRWNLAAASLSGERNRLASWLGLPAVESKAPSRESLLHPFDPLPFHAGRKGWVEDDLFDYEEYRRPNLFFSTEHGDLHVGRKKPRKGTGSLDRRAREAHAFARSEVYLLPGRYRIRTRIKLTTSYASGALIFGYTRRDYNLRFQFNLGDYMYAIGESEEEPTFQSMFWRLNGRRVRSGPLPGSKPGGTFEFERPMPAFDLELLVEGPVVDIFINGKREGAYHTVDGAPIEGYLGFATSFGAICAQRPMVERLDFSRHGDGTLPPLGLDVSGGKSRSFRELVNIPVSGIEASANGTIIVWIPMPWLSEGEEFDPDFVCHRARLAAERMVELRKRTPFPQPWILVVPEAVGEAKVAALKKDLDNLSPAPSIVTHAFSAWTSDEDPATPDECKRWCFFADHLNVLRVAVPWVNVAYSDDKPDRLWRWIFAFRDHGRPERDLPEYKRVTENEPSDNR